jgi:hypothetical protein
MQLRVSVENADAEVLDSETREVTVPDLTAPGARFGTPMIFRGRTVRDVQQIKATPDSVPTATREFQRTDRLVIRVPVYGAGGAAAGVTAKLLNRTGQPMSEVPVAADGSDAVMDLSLAALPTGDFILEIAGSGVTELIAFRVTS